MFIIFLINLNGLYLLQATGLYRQVYCKFGPKVNGMNVIKKYAGEWDATFCNTIKPMKFHNVFLVYNLTHMLFKLYRENVKNKTGTLPPGPLAGLGSAVTLFH